MVCFPLDSFRMLYPKQGNEDVTERNTRSLTLNERGMLLGQRFARSIITVCFFVAGIAPRFYQASRHRRGRYHLDRFVRCFRGHRPRIAE